MKGERPPDVVAIDAWWNAVLAGGVDEPHPVHGDDLKPMQEVTVRKTSPSGDVTEFQAICRIDTPVEIEYYRNGGILHTVLRKMLRETRGR